jgi:signal transduction histidine kinase
MKRRQHDRKLDSLKKKLETLLKEDSTDFQGIAQIAAEIAKLEPGVVRFTTDAAMVRRLGRELVAKQVTALTELVKNAYDADATNCTVNFDDRQGGCIQIIDNGVGMSRADIQTGFMRLASDAKIKSPVSPKYGRPRAGKKGIGRFATERLGRRLTIVTQTEAENHALTVTVDWTSFTQGEDINLIANSISTGPKERPHGTRLSIEQLNDAWSDADFRRVYRFVSTLLQPAFKGIETKRDKDDPGFEVQITRSGQDIAEQLTVLDADSEIFSRAVAVIEAKIDLNGNTTWWFSSSSPKLRLTSDPISIGLDRNRIAPLPNARNAELKAYYFIQLPEFLGHSTTSIRHYLNEYGGLRLYRNGYRVPPYGDREDDWLGLDYKRSTFAPIRSNAFLGYVAVSDVEGRLFEETSSREGLIETNAFRELRDIMSSILEAAVRRIESQRGRGRRPKKQNPLSGQEAAIEAEAAAAEMEELVRSPTLANTLATEDRERLRLSVARVKEAARTTAEIGRERDDLLIELNFLRILASMGLSIAEFTHDFSHIAETMELNLQFIKRAAATSADALNTTLARFDDQFRRVRGYIAHFGNMMTSNASRSLQTIDLYAFARAFRDDMSALFDRRGMELTVERPLEYEIYTTKMHPSEWSSILLNLLTNSIKAANRAQRPGRFLIRVGRIAPSSVYLEFSDNGDGIPVENRDRVFDAFFTTTGGSAVRAPDFTQAIGTGLGLKIVADIVHSVGGKAEVVDPPSGYVTSIRVAVPASSAEADEEDKA